MERNVKVCVHVVRGYIKTLQADDYLKLERKLKSVAREVDDKEKSSSEIHTAFLSYEKYLRTKFKGGFEKVERDKAYQRSRKYLTPQPLPGNTSGNGARGKQEEEGVSLSNAPLDAETLIKELLKKEDELYDLKDRLMNLAKECDIDGETPQTIITVIKKTIRELKHQETEWKTQAQTQGKMMKEIEDDLEELKKSVFNVEEVKNTEHSIATTKTKIHDLHRSEAELLELKKITFDEELIKVAFNGIKNEDKHTVDSAYLLVQELKRLFRNNEAERRRLLVAVVEEGPCSVDDALKTLASLKRARVDLHRLLEAICDSADSFNTDAAVERVQQLKESVHENNKIIQQQKAAYDQQGKYVSKIEQGYDSLMRIW